ncbi:MAG: flagellar basal-body MS-ring/collar protein FliF [Thiobacillus sp.]|nr:flagellar basal-body MS-ring/collar protein FliF [Thiobacillus sp.]
MRAVPGWLSSLRDLVAEASPWRRFMLALLVILPLAALAAAYLWFNPPVYRVLYAQLSDRAGGEVITALEQLDIPYRLSAVDGAIEVPANQLHAARYRLAARGLPKSDDDAQDEVDRAPRFGASSLQEQQRFQHALEIDLARSIQKLEVVELARVHLALPRVSPFLRDAPPATAAVLVRLRPGAQLSEAQVTTIQTLVAAGVPRLKRTEVQVLDPRGILLGAAAPEPVQSQRLVLEQDLARRALAVLTPWLGEDRVSVQVTASLEDSETRQTVERVQNVGPAGRGRPLEKTVRTTRVPEGRIQRIHAIVILGFDASANEQGRARQMASQALGLQPARGDRLNVYALPGAVPKPQIPAVTPQLAAPTPVSQVRPASPPPAAARPFALPQWSLAAAAAALILLALSAWLRARRTPVVAAADFDAELDAVRSQVLADPRVTADVVKLWMRA